MKLKIKYPSPYSDPSLILHPWREKMKSPIISGILSVLLITSFAILSPGYGYAGKRAPDREKQAIPAPLRGLLSSAEAGETQAQVRLGFRYHKGRGIARDYKKALMWYERAAAQGNAEAMFRLGQLYYSGLGMKWNYKKAFIWFKKAALQGYPEARFSLGLMYANGDGVPRDYVLSYMWFNLAGAEGYEPAGLRLDKLEAKMPPAKVKLAQKMSMEFRQSQRYKR